MSLGNKLGRAVGTIGAFAVEGSIRGATGLGQFGADLAEGAQQGYAEQHAALLITRAEHKASYEAKVAALRLAHIVNQNPAPMVAASAPKRGRVAV